MDRRWSEGFDEKVPPTQVRRFAAARQSVSPDGRSTGQLGPIRPRTAGLDSDPNTARIAGNDAVPCATSCRRLFWDLRALLAVSLPPAIWSWDNWPINCSDKADPAPAAKGSDSERARDAPTRARATAAGRVTAEPLACSTATGEVFRFGSLRCLDGSIGVTGNSHQEQESLAPSPVKQGARTCGRQFLASLSRDSNTSPVAVEQANGSAVTRPAAVARARVGASRARSESDPLRLEPDRLYPNS